MELGQFSTTTKWDGTIYFCVKHVHISVSCFWSLYNQEFHLQQNKRKEKENAKDYFLKIFIYFFHLFFPFSLRIKAFLKQTIVKAYNEEYRQSSTYDQPLNDRPLNDYPVLKFWHNFKKVVKSSRSRVDLLYNCHNLWP